jgi:hypothetical protein
MVSTTLKRGFLENNLVKPVSSANLIQPREHLFFRFANFGKFFFDHRRELDGGTSVFRGRSARGARFDVFRVDARFDRRGLFRFFFDRSARSGLRGSFASAVLLAILNAPTPAKQAAERAPTLSKRNRRSGENRDGKRDKRGVFKFFHRILSFLL